MTRAISRRSALGAIAASLALPACAHRAAGPRVVLYSSVDDYLLREIVPAYEAASGVRVDLVGDTEATKSAGLAQRLTAERARPRADVWWSSEPFFTIRLTREGILEPGAAAHALGHNASRWPHALVADDGAWAGLACRARLLVRHGTRITQDQAPTSLADLTDPRWRARVGIARPEFGTTRGHIAALMLHEGPQRVESWLRAMVANRVRVYAGNATVVRAVAQGEIDLALTDTDDIWAGQRNGWDVQPAFERIDPDADAPAPPTPDAPLRSFGALILPNTAGLVRNGPNPDEGRRLLAWILGGEAERFLARSESANIPVHPDVAPEFQHLAIEHAWRPDLERVADLLDDAATMAARVLGA